MLPRIGRLFLEAVHLVHSRPQCPPLLRLPKTTRRFPAESEPSVCWHQKIYCKSATDRYNYGLGCALKSNCAALCPPRDKERTSRPYDLAGRLIDDDVPSTWVRGEVYAGPQHVATYVNGLTFFNLTDWLGNERVKSSQEGTYWQSFDNLPFGDGKGFWGSDSGNAGPIGFTGDEHDSESNLEHAWFRQYSSAQGRWMTPDPWAGSMDLSNPQSLNRYAYLDPVNSIDPLGLKCMAGVMCSSGGMDLGSAGVSVFFDFGGFNDGVGFVTVSTIQTVDYSLNNAGAFGIGSDLLGSIVPGSEDTDFQPGTAPTVSVSSGASPSVIRQLNSCIVKNSKLYSIGGVANLIFNAQIPGSGFASNSITDTYTFLTGQDGLASSVWTAAKSGFRWARAANPAIMTNGPNSFTTINPLRGSPQAILGDGANYLGLRASFMRALKKGAEIKLVIDAGLAGALVVDCVAGQIK